MVDSVGASLDAVRPGRFGLISWGKRGMIETSKAAS
jgi:hypothetical protein